jgi:succinoglycan biosynthesis transport protein ExoP
MFQLPSPLEAIPRVTGADRVPTSMPAIDKVSRMLSAARRHMLVVGGFCLAGIAVGSLYVVTATPVYTASARIFIDNRQVRAVRDVSALADEPSAGLVAEAVESQAEVLRGESVGLEVIKELNLLEDPAFVDPPKSWFGTIWSGVKATIAAIAGHTKPVSDADQLNIRQQTALDTLKRNLRINRVGLTFVVEVAYTWPNPDRAAQIVNAYTSAYMLGQLHIGSEGARRARDWLQKRTQELRQLSVDADLAAQKFRAEKNLLAAKGTLITEQQLNEMTSELVKARVATAEAWARYERIKTVIENHQTEAAVTESLDNPVISGLRTKYLDAVGRLSALLARNIPSDHQVIVQLRGAIEELSKLLFQELSRVAQSYRSNYEIAKAREKALTENLAHQQTIAVAANDDQAQLSQLEQKAQSYKTLYQTYLQRYQEADQQESFPMTNERIVGVARTPVVPSGLRPPIVLAISAALGVLAGVGAAMFRELMDDVFRTVEQVRDELGIDVLGMLPIISQPEHGKDTVPQVIHYTIDHPFSEFAEALRSTKVAVDRALPNRSPKVVGLVSFLPSEGKSTIAKNFASLVALQGAKTLLIDADTRMSGLTRAIGRERRQNLRNELTLPPLNELLLDEPDSGLLILPCIYAADDPRAAHGLTPTTLRASLASSDLSFEYIVIDLPPVGPMVTAHALESEIDAFIFVIEWGKTCRGAVSAALAKQPAIRDKTVGIILNKVDMKNLEKYEHFRSDGYYRRQYGNYYRNG